MATWSAIAAGEYDPDSPITTGLVGKIIDNPLAEKKWARKTGDQTITNDNSLGSDTDLTLTVVGGQTWMFAGALYVVTDSAPDFQFSIATPDTGNDDGAVYFDDAFRNDGDGLTLAAAPLALNTAAEILFDGGGDGSGVIQFHGFVQLDATPTSGALAVAWAQNTSDGNNTTLKEDSYLYAVRLDPA